MSDDNKRDHLACYIQLLSSHDWSYQYSDDHSVWAKGNRDWQEICRLRKLCDPDLTIFDKYYPQKKAAS